MSGAPCKFFYFSIYNYDYDIFLLPHKRVVTFNNVNEQVIKVIKTCEAINRKETTNKEDVLPRRNHCEPCYKCLTCQAC